MTWSSKTKVTNITDDLLCNRFPVAQTCTWCVTQTQSSLLRFCPPEHGVEQALIRTSLPSHTDIYCKWTNQCTGIIKGLISAFAIIHLFVAAFHLLIFTLITFFPSSLAVSVIISWLCVHLLYKCVWKYVIQYYHVGFGLSDVRVWCAQH